MIKIRKLRQELVIKEMVKDSKEFIEGDTVRV